MPNKATSTAHCDRCGTIARPEQLILYIHGIGAEHICDDCFENLKNKHHEKQTPQRMDGPSPGTRTAGTGHHQNHRKI